MASADEFAPAINRMAQEIQRLEEEAAEIKRTVNKMCEFAGRGPMYMDADVSKANDISNMRRDQFFGVPLATAVRQYLEMRGDPKAGGLGAATVNEVYTALGQGGFDFPASTEENAKRGLRVSLSKNTAAFTRVTSAGEAAYGLREWYPAVKDKPSSNDDDEADEEEGDQNDEMPDQDSPDPASQSASNDLPDADEANGGSEPQ